MAQVINTNVLSLNAQRNLSTSQSSLATALQRLSSGLRINSAKDDAAGLAISDRFTTQIRGLNQAARNASDGISLSQVGESALGELTNNLQRIRELAVQAANSTNSASDRAALDLEVQQRLQEIERIATQTSFNGQKVLDGTFGSASFQVGANVGETISLNLGTSMRRTAIGTLGTATTVDLDTLINAGTPATPTTSTALGAVTASAVSDTDGQQFNLTIDGLDVIDVTQAGGNAETIDTARLQAAFDAFDTAQAGYSIAGTLAGGDLVVTKADGTDMVIALTNTFDNPAGTITGLGAFEATHTNGTPVAGAASLTITGLTIAIGDAAPLTVANGAYATIQSFVDAVSSALGSNAAVSLDANNVLSVIAGDDVTIAGANSGVFTSTTNAPSGSIDTANVLDLAAANNTIRRVDSALTAVSSLRSTFGAIQNRFESTIANLQAVSENLEASRSRILDADFAAETAALTKAQILQQAGIAILSQANAQPQSVLALLQ